MTETPSSVKDDISVKLKKSKRYVANVEICRNERTSKFVEMSENIPD